MKIKRIATYRFSAPLKRPFVTALRSVDHLEDIIVEIETENGYVGYGEGAPTPQITGETAGSIEAAIAFLAPMLKGKDIVASFETIIETLHRSIKANTTAKSALETALYDLKSQAMDLPLYQMLGGTKQHFQTDITISLNTVETMVHDALEAVALGYRILKIKIGEGSKRDAERILAIWDALPDGITLRLDANQGWSPQESVRLLHAIEKQGVVAECIEQPVRANDIEGLKYIKERAATPLLADESIFSLGDAKKVLEMQAVDYINIKLAKTGGITQALKLADLAKAYGVKCMMGCMLEGPIAIAAAVHVASAKADTVTMLDLDAVGLLASQPLPTEIVFEGSSITLSQKSGLGIAFEEKRYTDH